MEMNFKKPNGNPWETSSSSRWVRKILPPTYPKLLYTSVVQESFLGPLLGKEDVRTGSTKSAVRPHLNDKLWKESAHFVCLCISSTPLSIPVLSTRRYQRSFIRRGGCRLSMQALDATATQKCVCRCLNGACFGSFLQTNGVHAKKLPQNVFITLWVCL